MGNRPINRTPWRRGRPFRRGRRAPARWIDGSIQGFVDTPCQHQPLNFVCHTEPNVPMPPFSGVYQIVSGEVDLDWADKSESRLDRVVGDITLLMRSIQQEPDVLALPIFRMGMLVVEEVDDITTWVPPNLWDHDHLEEYEWMWLQQTCILDEGFFPLFDGNPLVDLRASETHHIDIRVKRKLGKTDHLVLLAQMSSPLPSMIPFNIAGQYVPLLRCVFVN